MHAGHLTFSKPLLKCIFPTSRSLHHSILHHMAPSRPALSRLTMADTTVRTEHVTVHYGTTSGPKTKKLNFSKIAANRLKIAARPSCPWKYNPNPPQANTDWAIYVRSWGVWHFRGDIAGNREMRENILLSVSNFWVHYNDKGMDWDMRQTRNALFKIW